MDIILWIPIVLLMYVSVFVYPAWQVLVMFSRRGWRLALSLLPVLPMGYIGVITQQAYVAGGNLWPLMLIFTSPIAVFWLWIVGALSPSR